MSILSDIENIEKKFNVNNILYKDINIWPYVRLYLSYSIFGKGKITANKKNATNALRNVFYGFWNIFKNPDYIFFTDTADRKLINNLYYDRIDFLDKKYKEKSLVFELTTTKYYSRNKIPTQNITSKIQLYLLSKIIKIFIGIKKIKGIKIIKEICNEKNIDIDIISLLKDYISHYLVAKLLIKIYKPKVLILAPSYTNMPYIAAFKKSKIKVIEFQHGLITNTHLAYNYKNAVNKNNFPDYLLSYGEIEKSIFNDGNYFITPDKVIPVGHFYIDYIKNNYTKSQYFIEKTKQYKLKIAVTLQETYENKLIEFINKVAQNNTDIIFVIIPRNKMNIKTLQNNVIKCHSLNCYEIILHSDIHLTIYSSCAIEALGLGKPNILVNIKNVAQEHFSFLLKDKNYNFLINTVNEFNSFVEKYTLKTTNIILSQKYFSANFVQNINTEFDKILNN